jgi:hypothetical protein
LAGSDGCAARPAARRGAADGGGGGEAGGAGAAAALPVARDQFTPRALRRGLCALFDLYPVARLQLALHRAEQPIFEEAAQLLERLHELFTEDGLDQLRGRAEQLWDSNVLRDPILEVM